jgi:hypothetical protein
MKDETGKIAKKDKSSAFAGQVKSPCGTIGKSPVYGTSLIL